MEAGLCSGSISCQRKCCQESSPGKTSSGPVVKILRSNARGAGRVQSLVKEITHASWPKHQNIEAML